MPQSLDDVWLNVAGIIASQISADCFKRWFSEASLHSTTDTTATIAVPNAIHKFWIETNFLNVVEGAVSAIIGPRSIEFDFPLEESPNGQETDCETSDKGPPSKETLRRPAKSRSRKHKHPAPKLNGSYTFERFVVGTANQFAAAACKAAAEKPGTRYNPLFIFGDAGLGKTHLMHAIGHQMLELNPDAHVVYISAEDFVNEFIEALRAGTISAFRKRYRPADVLLIDDVQFIAGKERSQDEFFHTFNTLLNNQKQIVMSCDRPAGEIANLEKRLLSRFEWGMNAQLVAPEEETRLAILRNKAEEWNANVDPSVLEFIAHRISRNVRRLEGALIRVLSIDSIDKTPVSDIEQVEEILTDLLESERNAVITIGSINKAVCHSFEISSNDINSRNRTAIVAEARQIAMYLTRELLGMSYERIGREFGNRRHGTVMHAFKLVKKRMESNPTLRRRVKNIKAKVFRT